MKPSARSLLPRLFCLILFTSVAVPLDAQLVVKLSAETVAAFEQYASRIKAETAERWQGKKDLFFIDEDAARRRSVLAGKIFIQQMNGGKPVDIKDGLIHDWLGAIFIPHVTLARVLDVLEDFNRHKDIYPAVTASRTISRNGNHVEGYWRLQQKGLVPITLDVKEDVIFSKLGPGKWKGESYGRNITEIDTGLFSRGREYPPGEGHGGLWRLYAYWTLEGVEGGVLAESRTLSLSRDIPPGLAWAVGPYVQKMPEQSLSSTLQATRDASEKAGK